MYNNSYIIIINIDCNIMCIGKACVAIEVDKCSTSGCVGERGCCIIDVSWWRSANGSISEEDYLAMDVRIFICLIFFRTLSSNLDFCVSLTSSFFPQKTHLIYVHYLLELTYLQLQMQHHIWVLPSPLPHQ